MITESSSGATRSRTGLAKLRGDLAASADDVTPPAAAQATEQPPAETEVRAPASGVVTLERVASPEPGEEPESTPDVPDAPRPPRRLRAAAVGLVLALVVLLVLVIAFASRLSGSSKAPSATSQGTPEERLVTVRAARQFAVSFFTYDYRRIGDYTKRIEASTTGNFRADFVSKEKTLKTVVTQLKTVATGQVPDTGAGLYTLSGDNATVLVAVNLKASNAVTKDGEKRYRVKIAMHRVNGTWLVSDFEQVV